MNISMRTQILPVGLREKIEGYVDFVDSAGSRRLQDGNGELFELLVWTIPASDTWIALPTHMDYPAFSIMTKAALLTDYLVRRTSPSISFKDVKYTEAFCTVLDEEVEPLFGPWPTLGKWLQMREQRTTI
ncbi:hypothetical protein OC835_003878 [Tilletia horrida]|nr:hypothetical protein OC835_003878 [Tilletia horrida]